MTTQQKSYYQAPQKRKGVSWVTFFIVLITTVFVTFIVYQNIDNIKDLFDRSGISEEDNSGIHIGDSVQFIGFIENNGDVRTYSHTMETSEYGIVGLKSRDIDLNLYTGEVSISGNVERTQGSIFVIEVGEIHGEKTAFSLEEIKPTYNSGKYFPQAGVYFPEEFFNHYELLNQGEGGEIKLKNLGSSQEIVIKYFKCVTGDPSKDCDQLAKNFANAGEKSFQTSHGIVMYKLYEIKSWFARSNYRGYFVNDAIESEVNTLAQYLRVVNDQMITDYIKPNASKICREGSIVMEKIDSQKISMKGNEIIVSLEGTTAEGTMDCQIALNPNLNTAGTVISVNSEEVITNNEELTGDVVESGDPETSSGGLNETNEDDSIIDIDDLNYSEQEADQEENLDDDEVAFDEYTGEQFPINLEKKFTFESRRGHKIIFPSGNISFAGVTVSTNLGEDGVNCFSQMNVVKYGTSEEDRDNNPSLKIYECSVKNGFVGNSRFKHIELDDGRHFIVEAVDPAWQSFMDHLEIE